MKEWLRRIWAHLRGPARTEPSAPPREHIPELHALRQQQTVYRARVDLLCEQLRAEAEADRRYWEQERDAR